MRIRSVELGSVQASHRTSWVFVRLTTDDGICGLGEASDGGDAATVARLASEASAYLVGRSPSVLGPLRDPLTHWCAARPPGERHAARTVAGGLRQAALDLRARAADLPVWQLLGGNSIRSVRLYANINRAARKRTAQEMSDLAEQAIKDGFWGIKCAPFDGSGDIMQRFNLGLEIISAIRERIGPKKPFMVDFHNHLSLKTVLRALPLLEELEVFWLEDAVPIRDIAMIRKLATSTKIPLAGGEHAYSPEDITDAGHAGGLRFVLPDVKHAGGIERAIALSRVAKEWGAQVVPHNPSGPIATLASAHMTAVIPNFHSLEFCPGEVDWRASIIEPPEQVDSGTLQIPKGPGFGVHLSESVPMHSLT